MIGATVSHYRILSKLGGGGMGVVYEAEDLNLGRRVALKVLPDALESPEALERFKREARAASALNHPHICVVYDLGEHEGRPFIAMERMQGETLKHAIMARPLPAERVLELGAQMADALEAAHALGIVHRDLKPANVFVTDHGEAKLLDFGLVKLTGSQKQPPGPGGETGTLEKDLTSPGTTFGTVAYMSPEQARGTKVDSRSDLFSLGVVLYEMATGRLPFSGTSAEIFNGILSHTPPSPSSVNPNVPPRLEEIILKALEKDRSLRYQQASEVRADLKRLLRDSDKNVPLTRSGSRSKAIDSPAVLPRIKRDTESGAGAVAAAPPRRRYLWVLVTALVVVTGLVALWPRPPTWFPPRVSRTVQVTREPGLEIDATISPDGKLVAYAAGPLGATKIYVQQVAGGRPLPLTEDLTGAHRFPRWSPDGTRLSFRSDLPGTVQGTDGTQMYIVPALGGAARSFPAPGALELAWSPDGEQIAYVTGSAVFVAPAEQGEPRKLSDAYQPSSLSWSPEGKRIAFTSGNSHYLFILLNAAPSSIWVIDVSSGEPVRLMEEDAYLDFSPVWTPDGKRLLFVSDRGGGRDIYAISVSPGVDPVGEPERLTTGLNVFTLASSANGRILSYSVATARQNIWSLPVLGGGPISVKKARPVTTGNQMIEAMDISGDGKWLVFDSDRSGNQELFKMPVGGGEPVQLTTAPAMDCCPSWSPDGTEVAFHSFRTGNRDIFIISANGGAARQLTNDPAQQRYPHWSPDGTKVVFQSDGRGVYVLSKDKGELSGETAVRLFVGGGAPRWSPDGGLIAYYGSGVSVIPAEGGQARRLTDFGGFPMWSKDSRTIYFKHNTPQERAGIWSVSSSGGEPKLLVRFDDPTRLPVRGEWSSDGVHFYFTLTEYEADVWVMELEDSRR